MVITRRFRLPAADASRFSNGRYATAAEYAIEVGVGRRRRRGRLYLIWV